MISTLGASRRAPLLVVSDLPTLLSVRLRLPQAQVVAAMDLATAIEGCDAPFVHVLTAETQLGVGYPALRRAAARALSGAGRHRSVVFPVGLLRGGRCLDLTFWAAGLAGASTEARWLEHALGLAAACRFVPRDSFVRAARGARTLADVQALYGLGGILARADGVVALDADAGAVVVEIGAHHGVLYRFAQMGHGEAGAPRHFGQAAALLAAPDPRVAVETLLRREVILQTLERGLPIAVFGTYLLNHLQFVADTIDGHEDTKKARAVLDALSDLLSDTDHQVALLNGPAADPFMISVVAIVNHRDYGGINPMALVRKGCTDAAQLIGDAISEGVPDAVLELASQPVVTWLPETRRQRSLRRAVSTINDVGLLIGTLVNAYTTAYPGRAPSVDMAFAIQDNADWLSAASCFAALFALDRNSTHLAGVSYNLARLGNLKLSRSVARFALNLHADKNIVLDCLFYWSTPPLLPGDPFPSWLEEQKPSFSSVHWDRYINLLLDSGHTEEARILFDELDQFKLELGLHIVERICHLSGDWRRLAQVQYTHTENGAMIEQRIAAVANSLAHLGMFEEADSLLDHSSVPLGIKNALRGEFAVRRGKISAGIEKLVGLIERRTFERRRVDDLFELIVLSQAVRDAAFFGIDVQYTLNDISQSAFDFGVKATIFSEFFESIGLCNIAFKLGLRGLVHSRPDGFSWYAKIYGLSRFANIGGYHHYADRLAPLFNSVAVPLSPLEKVEYRLLRAFFVIFNGKRWEGSLMEDSVKICEVNSEECDEDSLIVLIKDINLMSERKPKIFLFGFQTGDTYLFLSLIQDYVTKHQLERESVVAICNSKLYSIVNMFSHVFGDIRVANFFNFYKLQKRLEAEELHNVVIAHPEFLVRDSSGKIKSHVWREDFLAGVRFGLQLPADAQPQHPPIVAKTVSSTRRKKQISVFFAPMSNSFPLLPSTFWQSLSDRFIAQGWQVFVNKGPEGDPVLDTAVQIDLPHSELILFLNDVNCVIGLRSGLLDVISGTSSALITLNPTYGLNTAWCHLWSLQPLRLERPTDEIHILLNEYDEAALVEDVIERAMRLAGKTLT